MFAYCTDVLHLSEAEAYLRIAAARASRKHPMLLVMLEEGRLHLSGIAKLAPHLTSTNCEDVLARAAHKSKREIEELVAELSPRPDVPAVIRKVPTPLGRTTPRAPVVELGPDAVKFETTPAPVQPVRALRLALPAAVEPLSPARYKVQFTARRELRDKLGRLQALMGEDLAAVIEAAVTEKPERLEAKRYAVTKSPRKSPSTARSRRRSRLRFSALRRE